jgi:hypothetical protein
MLAVDQLQQGSVVPMTLVGLFASRLQREGKSNHFPLNFFAADTTTCIHQPTSNGDLSAVLREALDICQEFDELHTRRRHQAFMSRD